MDNQQPTVTCPNCGAVITCGCQQRTASNGVNVCSSCHGQYEQNLYAQQQLQQLTASNPQ
jgi:ribosomal protein L31